tara:strand:+ start:4508 stop:4756 length:249 start_codon:yes stop_codon:yes gene_type:complete
MTKNNKEKNLEQITFEEAIKELENIVDDLERGEVSLEEAVSAYERGSKLKNICQERLNDARMKVEKIKQDESGQISIENFEE